VRLRLFHSPVHILAQPSSGALYNEILPPGVRGRIAIVGVNVSEVRINTRPGLGHRFCCILHRSPCSIRRSRRTGGRLGPDLLMASGHSQSSWLRVAVKGHLDRAYVSSNNAPSSSRGFPSTKWMCLRDMKPWDVDL
jgi:hypothetical protein